MSKRRQRGCADILRKLGACDKAIERLGKYEPREAYLRASSANLAWFAMKSGLISDECGSHCLICDVLYDQRPPVTRREFPWSLVAALLREQGYEVWE